MSSSVAIAIRFRQAVSLAGRFPLLAGVTYDVAEGEIVHLRGPNGAGKTSLLRACAGLVPIVAGERTNEIFIENGRFHGQLIAEALRAKLMAV